LFFATFFGFLGLLLSLPLTVVGQIWFKEVIVKDVLDNWNYGFVGHKRHRQSKKVQEVGKLEEE
jgi:predicted PurR-regulated permease PerM